MSKPENICSGLSEAEKCDRGLWYSIEFPGRAEAHLACDDLCWEYNQARPSDLANLERILRRLFGKVGKNPYVEPSIWCGFGTNIEVGDNFYANNNCVFVDPAKITFGDNVFIGPMCGFYTAIHALNAELRNQAYEKALPITVGDNVWFGGSCTILPGVTIGSNTVIGAGSVVTKDIPSGVLAFGNPCTVRREIGEGDKQEILSQRK